MNLDVNADAPFTFVLNEATKILAVDDDPIQLEFACVYLGTPAASVETASCGAEGLEKLRSDAFDIVLCDLDMPGMNGLQVIRAIRADPKLMHLPVVVVTGREDVLSIDRAYEAGATSFVTKPVNWRLLSYQLRYVLRAHALSATVA